MKTRMAPGAFGWCEVSGVIGKSHVISDGIGTNQHSPTWRAFSWIATRMGNCCDTIMSMALMMDPEILLEISEFDRIPKFLIHLPSGSMSIRDIAFDLTGKSDPHLQHLSLPRAYEGEHLDCRGVRIHCSSALSLWADLVHGVSSNPPLWSFRPCMIPGLTPFSLFGGHADLHRMPVVKTERCRKRARDIGNLSIAC